MSCVIIGLGNPLMGDDGLGLAALERLRRAYVLPDAVRLVDGGTAGLGLLPIVEGATRLLLLDAIRTGATPGAVVELEGVAVPRHFAVKLSPHQIDLPEVLALAELRGRLAADIAAIGAEPARIALTTELSSAVEDAVPAVVARAVERLAAWGYVCVPVATIASHPDAPAAAATLGAG